MAASDYKEPQVVCQPNNYEKACNSGVNCLNPEDSQSIRQYSIDGIYPALTASSNGGQNRSGVCYENDNNNSVKCFNPWDCQSKTQYDINGVYRTLDAGNAAGGQAHGICYAINSQSSNSWKSNDPNSGVHLENVTKTLDTKPDPACNQGGNVIVQSAAFTNRGIPSGETAETLRAESHGAIPMVAAFMGGQGAKARSIAYCDDGTTPTIKASPSGGNTVPDTVYCLQGNGIDRSETAGCNGAGWRENINYTLNTIDRPAVVFEPGAAKRLDPNSRNHNQNHLYLPIENHAADSRCELNGPEDPCQTLTSRMGTGGNNVPMILACMGGTDSNAAINEGDTSPTLMARAGTGGGNVPMILMKEKEDE